VPRWSRRQRQACLFQFPLELEKESSLVHLEKRGLVWNWYELVAIWLWPWRENASSQCSCISWTAFGKRIDDLLGPSQRSGRLSRTENAHLLEPLVVQIHACPSGQLLGLNLLAELRAFIERLGNLFSRMKRDGDRPSWLPRATNAAGVVFSVVWERPGCPNEAVRVTDGRSRRTARRETNVRVESASEIWNRVRLHTSGTALSCYNIATGCVITKIFALPIVSMGAAFSLSSLFRPARRAGLFHPDPG
jgi:hypothetical protein